MLLLIACNLLQMFNKKQGWTIHRKEPVALEGYSPVLIVAVLLAQVLANPRLFDLVAALRPAAAGPRAPARQGHGSLRAPHDQKLRRENTNIQAIH